MRTIRAFIAATLVTLLAGGLAHAQASRTWVSGAGNDSNSCLRTAPCKTFAGALAKTTAGGEIDVLDPDEYGPVTITKSITIDGGQGGGWAGILNPGLPGILVSAPDAVVTLRNLSINGLGSGQNGIRILAAQKVFVENCQIFGNSGADPAGRGISDLRSQGGQLLVTNTIVRNNAQTGIVIQPTGGATVADMVFATLRGVSLIGNGNAGLAVTGGVRLSVTGSNISGNAIFGLYMEQSGAPTNVFVSDTTIAENGTGAYLWTGFATLRLSNVVITDNEAGVINYGTITIYSHGNNRISGNDTSNSPVVTTVPSI